MNADQPLVTHADLKTLRQMQDKSQSHREWSMGEIDAVDRLLDRLIREAEADKPALPEGWVLYSDGVMGMRVLWHFEGALYVRRDLSDRWQSDASLIAHNLTPLATAASLVPEGWHVDEDGDGRPTVWDGDDEPIVGKAKNGNPSPVFDVLAAFVSAAQAERGESR